MEMTPELAVKILRASEQECWLNGWDKGAAVDYVYSLASKWVAKALEQEPCEDAVSRKAVFGLVKQMYLEVANSTVDSHTISDCISLTASKCREYIDEHIRELPSVTSTRKKGKWIVEDSGNYNGKYSTCYCSNCKDYYTRAWREMKFCPNCGAEMRGSEECE